MHFDLNAVSILAVWIPFRRALALYAQARRATQRVPSTTLRAAEVAELEPEGAASSMSLVFLRVLRESTRENQDSRHPLALLRDAARQYTENEFAASYSQPLSMYANILPPIGFIGTTAGLMVLFTSMRLASDTLELGGLALALSSTLFALLGYATLEALKIRLYRRLLECLDDVVHTPSPQAEVGDFGSAVASPS